ncbi:hypothetical protein PFISCL1PPCAC_21162, partial [Pristionchus fissidentatus]
THFSIWLSIRRFLKQCSTVIINRRKRKKLRSRISTTRNLSSSFTFSIQLTSLSQPTQQSFFSVLPTASKSSALSI